MHRRADSTFFPQKRTCVRLFAAREGTKQSVTSLHQPKAGGWAREWSDESKPAQPRVSDAVSAPPSRHMISAASHPARDRSNSQLQSPGQVSRPSGSRMTEAGQQLLEQLLTFGFPAEWKRLLAWTVNTYGIEKRLMVPIKTKKLPSTSKLIIVEGTSDCSAVHQSVHAVVYTCDGSSIKSDRAAKHLAAMSRWPAGVIILTDPDAPGRELRMFLDEELVQKPLKAGAKPAKVLHAFVPVDSATALDKSKWHEEGSVGIENASPAAITQALKTARPSFPDTRKEFTVQELQELGLANTFDAKQGSGNKLRRELVCDILGIDKCTGKSLASMLNRFFTRAELLAALDTAKHRIQNELKLG